MKTWIFIVLLGLATALTSCKRNATGLAGKKLDSCALLTNEEIGSVQGARIVDTKSSEHLDAGFRISQCYFTANPSNKAISLIATQIDPDHPTNRTPKDYWKQTFDRSVTEEKESDGAAEEKERESRKPVKIASLGDDAFWVADRVGGALYAIKKDVFIRISLGGPDDQETKLEKSKKLAQKALDRL